MEFLDLPDECVLLVLGHLPVPSTVTCAATCKRLRALVHSDSLWIPRIRDELGVNIKVIAAAQGEAEKLYRAARQRPIDSIRFWGCFTDGGCDANLRQYGVDNMFAPNSWESYCSALPSNLHCIGLLTDGDERLRYDSEQLDYRAYLLRRLRIPSGVVFGQGLVDMALIQGTPDVDSAVMQRLQSMSLAELEHLFLEFYQELQAGHTLGRLLLHGLAGTQRETERSFMATVALRIEKHMRTRVDDLRATPSDVNLLWDANVVCDGVPFNKGRTVSIVESLKISRAGHFSCPVLAGVIFLANVNWSALHSSADVLGALMDAIKSPACKAFDDLKDEESLSEAVKAGRIPGRTKRVSSYAGSYYTFARESGPASRSSGTRSAPIGCLQPVVWFNFHTREEAKKWGHAKEPVELWRGQDPDLAQQPAARDGGIQQERPVPGEQREGAAGPGENGAPAAEGSSEAAGGQSSGAGSAVAAFVGEIHQMAQSWLGSGQPLPSESGDASAASEQTESSTSEGEDADMGDDEEDEDGHGDADADVDVDDGDEDADIMDAHPRGTKGRDMMEIQLEGRVAGNLALVKLINQEDLMHEWDDQHDAPNIDINHVIFSGRFLTLPNGMMLAT